MLGAKRLHAHFPRPHLRVVACDDAAPFIAKGGNVFAKHVLDVDPEVRAAEEVLVVDSSGPTLGHGHGRAGARRNAADQTRSGCAGEESRRALICMALEPTKPRN